MTADLIPRILLVEDDVVSRAFLSEALASLPAHVDVAENVAQAARLASSHAHSLWLVDANLPDGNGVDCLLALRLRQSGTPALAITAEAQREGFDTLCRAGFSEVLQKPISVAALLAGVRRALGQPGGMLSPVEGEKQPTWDERSALAAVAGNRDTLAILRRMFIEELPRQRDQILAACARRDIAAACAELHKLKASCGFVGAARLLLAVQHLADSPLNPRFADAFENKVEDTLASHS